MKTITHMFKVEGPRWARSDLATLNLAMAMDVKVVVDRRTSWFIEHVFITVIGTRAKVKLFVDQIQNAIKQYNEENDTEGTAE